MTHGLIPVEYKIIVLPDPVDETAGEGIIVKAESTKNNDERMQTRGTLIAASEMAFTNDDGQKWRCVAPIVGEKIEFAMYAGQFLIGDDGTKYKVMADKDVVAIVRGESWKNEQ